MSEPFARGEDHPACGICPSKQLPREAFLVYDRPSWECPFNPEDGFRYTAEGTPVCVHPHKVGLDPDRMAPPPKPVDDVLKVTPQRRRGWRPSFLGR